MSAALERGEWSRAAAERRRQFQAKILSKAVEIESQPVVLGWLENRILMRRKPKTPIGVDEVCYPYAIGPCRPWMEEGQPEEETNIVLVPRGRWAFVQARRVRAIVDDICARYDCTPLDLASASRQQKLAHARQEAFYRVQEVTGWSLPRIGRYFGDRDHTTVLHGIRAHKARMAQKAEQARGQG